MFTFSVFRLSALAIATLCAVWLGFFAFDNKAAIYLVKHFGYWMMLLCICVLVSLFFRGCSKRLICWRNWLSEYKYPIGFVGIATAVVLQLQVSEFKIVMDEPVLAMTAQRMHEYKEVFTTGRSHEIQGVFTQLDGYVDKRPFFFPFLVSLLNDVTGYRSFNSILLNGLLTPVFLGLLFYIGNRCWAQRGGYLAVALIVTLPLLSMTANGGGMGMLNIVMLLATSWAAISYLEQPDVRRMDILIYLGILLAQTRYESVLFVLSITSVVFCGWFKLKRIEVSWFTCAAPLFLVPYGLQRIIFDGSEAAYELREGSVAAFSLTIIPDNLRAAADFFFNTRITTYPNSALLSILFVLSILVLFLRFAFGRWKWKLSRAEAVTLLSMGAVVLFNFFLLMSYHWGQLNDIMATRIALPFIVLQVLVCAGVASLVCSRAHVSKLLYACIAIFFFGFTLPSAARNDYLQWVPGQHEVKWVQGVSRRLQGDNVLLITNVHIVSMAERIAAIPQIYAKRHKAQLKLHLDLHTYNDVFMIHRIVLDEEGDEFGYRSLYPVYKDFELELIEEAKLGRERFIRLSRVLDVKWLDDEKKVEDILLRMPETDDEKTIFNAVTLP